MCSVEIKQPIENRPCQDRKVAPPTDLDAALESNLIFQCNVNKAKAESLLHNIQVETPPIARSYYDQHDKELLNILKYVQPLGMVNTYHQLDIDLVAETVAKHYFCDTMHNFKAQELDLNNT